MFKFTNCQSLPVIIPEIHVIHTEITTCLSLKAPTTRVDRSPAISASSEGSPDLTSRNRGAPAALGGELEKSDMLSISWIWNFWKKNPHELVWDFPKIPNESDRKLGAQVAPFHVPFRGPKDAFLGPRILIDAMNLWPPIFLAWLRNVSFW